MSKIGAIVLAAGGSSRFGRPKQLIEFEGKTLLRRVIEAGYDADCSTVIVVTGSNEIQARRELQSTRATVVHNENWQSGIASSIRAGVQHLIDQAPDIEAAVLMACDQPFVTACTIRDLVAMRRRTNQAIVASSYANTLGVPALFDRSCFGELLELDGDSGAKSVIVRDRGRVAEFPFPDGKIDIDTVEDWQRLKKSESNNRQD